MAHSVQGCGRSRASRKEEPTGGTAVETSGTLRMQKTPPGLVPKEVSVSLMVSCRGSKERYCHLGRNQVKTGRKEWLKRMSENFPKKREKRNKDGGCQRPGPLGPPSLRKDNVSTVGAMGFRFGPQFLQLLDRRLHSVPQFPLL